MGGRGRENIETEDQINRRTEKVELMAGSL